jgi:hypothetical protein
MSAQVPPPLAPPAKKKRWFFDTEFAEDGKTIDLISIAFVCEDGREYYAVSKEFDLARCNAWVKANVLPKLPPFGGADWKTRREIAEDIRGFLLADGEPEIWAYFADYDWVVLCQLYGTMEDLPKGFPYWCRDLKQLMADRNVKREDLPPDGQDEHSALADAKWARNAYEIISGK